MEVTLTVASFLASSVTFNMREFGDTQTLKSPLLWSTVNVTMTDLWIGGDEVSVAVMVRL
jgi:hypothetical protein